MRTPTKQSGFTLAEVMVTIALVGAVLIFGLKGLNDSMFQAAYTRDLKIARELALFSMGQVSSGLFIEDVEDHMSGDYADQDYPEFSWEIVLGDEEFDEPEVEREDRFDSWNPNPDDDDDEEEDAEEPYEIVRVKVRFPAAGERVGELILEEWITWEHVYGQPNEEDE
ncbi:MAG: type II secretion system protein [Planctomycetota bacterium]|nr:type II secretion system protein [Planctomycetota bacterium]